MPRAGAGWRLRDAARWDGCPAAGPRLFVEHELIQLRRGIHASLALRPVPTIEGREGESLVVWTTTPWTLPGNVAAAVKPDAECGLTEEAAGGPVERNADARRSLRRARGEELVGLEYEGPFD